MSGRIATVSAMLGVLSACTCHVPDMGTYACGSDSDCAAGFVCRRAVCVTEGAGGGSGRGGGAVGGGSVGGGGGGGGGAMTCFASTDCATSDWCSQGTCIPRQMNGTPCMVSDQCTSAVCTEGYCCDSACSGACDSCAVPGLEGRCSPVAQGTEGTPACDPYACNGVLATCPPSCASTSDCVSPLFCDAMNHCSPSLLPRNVTPPAITADGGFVPGNPLTADDGTWSASSGGAILTAHRWLICDDGGMNCVPLTTAGSLTGSDLQTDATRAAAIEGDGRLNDSSVGTWIGTKNLVPNGGFETGTANWTALPCCMDGGLSAALSQTNAAHKFGMASLGVTTANMDLTEGAMITLPVATGATLSASAWVNAPASAKLCFEVVELDAMGGVVQEFGAPQFTPTGGWLRVSRTGTTSSSAVQLAIAVDTCGTGPQSVTYYVDGVQLEAAKLPTPYVETSASAVTRNASVLNGPSSAFDVRQGWVAFRARPEWTAAVALQAQPPLLALGASSSNGLAVSYDRGTGEYALERDNGPANIASSARPVVAGTADTVVAAWTASSLAMSVNGVAFSKTPASTLPDMLPATFSLGPFDGELLWMAAGAGTLSDADAVTLHNLGDTDPSIAALPGRATLRWDATQLVYDAVVTGATYTPSSADLGHTLRLEVTATNANGETTQLSPPVLIVPPPPAVLQRPTVAVQTGGYYASGVLTATTGTWANNPTSFSYQWQRCTVQNVSCVSATGTGATSAQYTIDATDVGFTLRVQVKATNAGGSTKATSTQTVVIVNPAPVFKALGVAATTTSGTSVMAMRPAVASGHLMLALVTWGAAPGSVTLPAGWSLAAGSPQTAPAIAVYWAIAGAAEPPGFTFSWANATSAGAVIAVYSGTRSTMPVSATAVGGLVMGSKSATVPGVTTTGGYQVEVGFSSANVSASWSTLAGWNQRTSSFGSNPNGGLADRTITAAGSTGSATWASTVTGSPNNVNSVSLAIAIAPP